MALNVRRNVLVMGMRSGKGGILRMWLRIIPVKLFLASIHSVRIIFNSSGVEINPF